MADYRWPGGPGRVHVSLEACPSFDCTTAEPPDPVAFSASADPSGTAAMLRVRQSNQSGMPVLGYEARLTILPLGSMPIDGTNFSAWTPAGTIAPGPPDTEITLTLTGLTPLTRYAVGIRARGPCGDSALTFQRFVTPAHKFTQLSGCFIATAAFGSDLAPEVQTLRTLRDLATTQIPLARAAVDLYYRASPPLAALISRSNPTRALIRTPLRAF